MVLCFGNISGTRTLIHRDAPGHLASFSFFGVSEVQAQLAVFILPKRISMSLTCHSQSVKRSARHKGNLLIFKLFDQLRHQFVNIQLMAEPSKPAVPPRKQTPFLSNRGRMAFPSRNKDGLSLTQSVNFFWFQDLLLAAVAESSISPLAPSIDVLSHR